MGLTVSAVEPKQAATNESTSLTIIGRNFLPQVFPGFRTGSPFSVNQEFEVLVGEENLEGVVLEDDTHVSGILNSGLPIGIYDLTLRGPDGHAGVLKDAFEITMSTVVGDDGGLVVGQDGGPAFDGGADAGDDAGMITDGGGPLVADGGDLLDAGVVMEAGNIADAGDVLDAGENLDAGVILDAGDIVDSGSVPDAGSVVDAGSCDWWDSNWSRRQQVTFDNSAQAEDLNGFTVLVTLGPAFDYGQTAAGGVDLRFLDDDHITELSYHVEEWNVSGVSRIWLNVPTINALSSSDFVWMYYGNASAPDVMDSAGSFDVNTVAAWHMNETSGSHVDAKGGLACAFNGGGTMGIAGQISLATYYNGMGGGSDCGSRPLPDPEFHTISAWVNLPLLGDDEQEIFAYESLNNPYRGLSIYIQRVDGAIGRWLDGTYVFATNAASKISADQWTFIAIRGRKDAAAGYVQVSQNGGPWEGIGGSNTSTMNIPVNTPLFLGAWTGAGGSGKTQGNVDEIRFSNIARSDAWMRARYLSESNSNFIALGPQESTCP